MGDFYDSPKYDVEHILALPGTGDLSAAAADICRIPMPDPITVVEFGITVKEAITAVSSCTVILREGGTTLATLSIPSTSAIGTLVSTRTVTANAFGNAGILDFETSVTTAGVGEVSGAYMKYRRRYAA